MYNIILTNTKFLYCFKSFSIFAYKQEFADALKNFVPDHDAIKDAQLSAEELEKVKDDLNNKRKDHLEKLKKEKQDFEKDEERRVEAEMESFAKQLEDETKKEKQKYEKNLDTLNQRKEDLIKERKQKMKVS